MYEHTRRIRTDGDYVHRERTLEDAADELECNKTQAVLISCEVTGTVLPRLAEAIAEADIRPSEKQALVDAMSTRRVDIEIESDVNASVSVD